MRREDCPGPREETTTRRNVTQGGGGGVVRGQSRGEIFVFQLGPKFFPRNTFFLRNLGRFLVLVPESHNHSTDLCGRGKLKAFCSRHLQTGPLLPFFRLYCGCPMSVGGGARAVGRNADAPQLLQRGEPTWALLLFGFISDELVLFKIWAHHSFTQLIVHQEPGVGGVEVSRV